ncbi:unnamed protein product [Clavelina lepadiformis]|uniref:PA14 domain-containing protein n=1 Tax=Clavelina lepadiformis TaxID=159417 RepID=A0ABP0FV01_CLALP
MFVFTIFLLGVLQTAVSEQEETAISHILPRRGGINGAIRIQIFGSNFPSEFCRYRCQDPIKQVYLVSEHQEYECDLHNVESDKRQTVCYTRPMLVGVYYVRMRIRGIPLDDSRYCNAKYSERCRFEVSSDRTPLISSLNWTSGEPLKLISIHGTIFTNLISSLNVEATNGNTATITRVWSSSGQLCNLYKPSGESYGIALDGYEGSSNQGHFTCLLKGSYVGSQNLSFIVDPGYSRSEPDKSIVYVDANDDLYMLQTYAVINDVNPKNGSSLGGTKLTISGNFFYNSSGIEARVLVGGQVCELQSVTATEITCLTPEQPAEHHLYSGGRGFKLESQFNQNDINAVVDSSSSDYWVHWTDKIKLDNIKGNNFISRIRGFFVPSKTGRHRFTAIADDQIYLYINPDGKDPDGKQLALQQTTANETTSASAYSLIAGTEYYYEINHLEKKDIAMIKLSVYVDRTNYSPDQTNWSVNEIQHIKVTSILQREIQTIKFKNWVTQTATQSTWTVMLSCSYTTKKCVDSKFHFSLFGIRSGAIRYGASDTTVEVELESMVVLALAASEDVSVTEISDGYKITFSSSRGQMPLVAESTNPSLSITLSETTTGVPDLATFTFSNNNRVSAPLNYATATTSDVAAAVSSLFAPKCPNSLERGIGRTVGYYHGFESDDWGYGGIRTGEESFCGVNSIKNPVDIFNDNDYQKPAYSLSHYPYVCFAYKGRIHDRLSVSFTYKDSNTSLINTVFSKLLNTVGLDKSTEEPKMWKHFCCNLHNRLQSVYASGRSFKVKELQVNALSGEDLYLDNVFIGDDLAFDNDEARESALDFIIPSVGADVKLENVEVTKNNDGYTMTFIPINCGYNFPLIGLAFAETSTTISTKHDKYVFGNDANTSPQVHVFQNSSATPPVTGTFDLSFEDSGYGQLIGLDGHMEAWELQAELQTLPKVEHVEVTGSGTCYGYDYKVKFTSPSGDYPLMRVDVTNLEPKTHSVAVEVSLEKDGGLYMSPIHGDFVRTAHEKPQYLFLISSATRFKSSSTTFLLTAPDTLTTTPPPRATSISPGIELTTTTASDFAFDIGDLVPAADILSEIEDFQSASTTSASTTSASTTSTVSPGIELTTTTASDFAFDIGDLVPAADILSEIEDFQSASTTSASTTSASTTSTGIELTTTTASNFGFDIGDLVPAADILSEIEDFQSASTTSASTTSASATSTGIELTTTTASDFGFDIGDLVPAADILSEIEDFQSASTTSASTTSASTTSASTTSASTTSTGVKRKQLTE